MTARMLVSRDDEAVPDTDDNFRMEVTHELVIS